MNADKILEVVKNVARKLILYTPHAVRQMNLEERIITADEVEGIIFNGKIIEEYPEDKRGHSCLICGKVKNRFIHVVCAPKDDYLAIITAYIPDETKWEETFTKRQKL